MNRDLVYILGLSVLPQTLEFAVFQLHHYTAALSINAVRSALSIDDTERSDFTYRM